MARPVTLPSFQSAVRDYPGGYRPDRFGGALVAPNMIVIHETDGRTARSAFDWQNRPLEDGEGKSSYHYLIDDATERGGAAHIWRGVPLDRVAYHAGRSAWPLPAVLESIRGTLNGRSIGVAWCCHSTAGDRVTPWQYDAGLWLVATLCRRFGIPPHMVRGHKEIAPLRRRDPVTVDCVEFRRALALQLGR